MSKKISILIFLSVIKCYSKNDDTTLTYKKEIWAEAGHSTSAFFQKYNGVNINNYGVSSFRIGYNHKRLGFYIDKFSFAEYHIPYKKGIAPKGYLYLRNYIMFNLGLKYRFYNNKLRCNIEPYILLSYRKYGTENIYVDQNKILYPVITYYNHFFYYENSFGFGLGINLKKNIYRNLYTSIGIQYNHFDKKIPYSRDRYGVKEYNDMIRNYKISNDFLTGYINIGYTFQFPDKYKSK